MSLLNPAWLLLGLLAVPILLLYMLKLRRKQVEVSSSMLWQMLLRDRQANAPWQRLKRNLLLFLQLLILAALVFALARPSQAVPTMAAGPLVILIDGSASMNAIDVSPNRFEAAKTAARSLIDHLDADSPVSLFLAGSEPQVLASATTDRQILARALEAAQPGQGPADWQSAFALAAGAASARGSETSSQATIVILSDGGLPADGLPPLPGDVRYIPVGSSGENLAVSALSIRQAKAGAELFAQVSNYGRTDKTAIFSLYRDGSLFQSQNVAVPAGQNSNLLIPNLLSQPSVYQAQLSTADPAQKDLDSFSLDDSAYVVYRPPKTQRVLLVSSGNLFLEQALAAMPGLTSFKALPGADGQIQIPQEPFDLYVLDGMIPAQLPTGNLLLVDPPSNPLFSVTGVFSDTHPAQVIDNPITRYVDWDNVHVLKARSIQVPDWASPLVTAPGGPLVFSGETGGRRVGVIAFDLHESDLPLQVAFPILLNNLAGYLSPQQAFSAPDGLQPGDRLAILPGLDIDRISVTLPDGKVEELTPGEQGVSFTDTGELGLYSIRYTGNANQPDDQFAVNLFDPLESDIQPAGQIQVGRAEVQPASQNQIGQRELWPWFASAGLAILMVEWLVYHRRSRYQLPKFTFHLRRSRT